MQPSNGLTKDQRAALPSSEGTLKHPAAVPSLQNCQNSRQTWDNFSAWMRAAREMRKRWWLWAPKWLVSLTKDDCYCCCFFTYFTLQNIPRLLRLLPLLLQWHFALCSRPRSAAPDGSHHVMTFRFTWNKLKEIFRTQKAKSCLLSEKSTVCAWRGAISMIMRRWIGRRRLSWLTGTAWVW